MKSCLSFLHILPEGHPVKPQRSAPDSPSAPLSPPRACTHSRVISDCVTDEEHKTGKVRCVECGGVVPDPHLQREVRGI